MDFLFGETAMTPKACWVGLRIVPLVFAATAQAQVGGLSVPRGGGIALDGRVDDAEWSAAVRMQHPAGTVVRLLRDADHLYLGITSVRPGFASLCLAQGNAVHVLHASAALGAVTYRPAGQAWRSPDTAFAYGMRNTALDESAQRERAAYLATHGWVATTVRMSGDQRSQEIQIALSRFPLPWSLAMGRWMLSSGVETWPGTLTDHEACVNQRLVQGYVPQDLTFKTAHWLTIERN